MTETGDLSNAPGVPPHDLQAEMGVIGSMLLSAEALYMAREQLYAESFYKLAHQDIYSAILKLSYENNAVDLILLRDELSRQDKLEKVGGVGYLAELMEAVPTSANVEYYIEIVRNHAIRRRLIEVSARAQKGARDHSRDVEDLLDEAEAQILAVRAQKERTQVQEINTVLQSIVARLEELHQNPGQLTGLATGLIDLDNRTNGFQSGQLIVLASRPSMGKTSLALNILHNVCATQRKPAALYSLEMPAQQIVSNFLCIHNRLDTHNFRRGTLSDKEWERLETSIDELVDLPLYISDSPTLRIMDLRARARRLCHQHEVCLIVVDYLQLMTATRQQENRATEVAEISRGLKAIARELEVPLLALSQLSRRVEQDRRQPRLSDLRESGAIEQDADVVILLHRPHLDTDAPDEDTAGAKADLIVAKQRNGPTGIVPLSFQKRYLRFEPRAKEPADYQ